jgi:hypothetical protein
MDSDKNMVLATVRTAKLPDSLLEANGAASRLAQYSLLDASGAASRLAQYGITARGG